MNSNIYLFLERENGRKKNKERNTNVREKIDWFASHTSGFVADNLGMRPDQE